MLRKRTGVSTRFVLLVGLSSLACSGEQVLGDYPPCTCDLAEPPSQLSDTPLSIATFWAADPHERDAFQTLVERVDQQRYFVSTQQMSTRVAVQRHISDAFESQQLPDVFQVNAGSDVLRWVQDQPRDASDVCSLDRLRERYHYERGYFAAALAPLSCHGSLYGLPVGIHHLNVLFYNTQRWQELSARAAASGAALPAPDSLQSAGQLVALLGRIAELGITTAEGAPLVPLAMGTESGWPLTILAFEDVLLGLERSAYETLWMGGLAGAAGTEEVELRRRLSDVLSLLRQLRGFSNAAARSSWQAALRQVGTGEALMTAMGDWGWAQLSDEAKANVAMVTFPGTAGTFVYTPDSFAVPRELGKNGFPARSFLHDVVEDKDALIEFSNAKHSIPPRRDLSEADIARLSRESLRATYRDFTRCQAGEGDCRLLLAVSGLAPPPGTDACFDEMDALLAIAVDDSAVALDAPEEPRACAEPFPKTSQEAEQRLLDLLIGVARRRFAAACR
ncbi:MAG TPA: extracellular solute-binding protein [Polyangiaceae bacterium]|nr:extracellular solute-binding protein [Polyangiaceae bacterium]